MLTLSNETNYITDNIAAAYTVQNLINLAVEEQSDLEFDEKETFIFGIPISLEDGVVEVGPFIPCFELPDINGGQIEQAMVKCFCKVESWSKYHGGPLSAEYLHEWLRKYGEVRGLSIVAYDDVPAMYTTEIYFNVIVERDKPLTYLLERVREESKKIYLNSKRSALENLIFSQNDDEII